MDENREETMEMEETLPETIEVEYEPEWEEEMPKTKKYSDYALWSVICGCAGFLLIGIFGSLIGLYLSHKAAAEGDDSDMNKIGKILSIAGIIYNALLLVLCGWVLVGLMFVGLIC